MAMLDVGDEVELIEHQLLALGISRSVASAAADNAGQLAS
jgi:hypothetical protein